MPLCVASRHETALQGATARLGKPADLAAITAFLLSEKAECINGQTWFIGGASHMGQ
jgi:NAD(P)-dependent dehydrogenase (short-subunit alcohol dehydrogenase family)